jgi:hypothetical protein
MKQTSMVCVKGVSDEVRRFSLKDLGAILKDASLRRSWRARCGVVPLL